ncbi:unnamed protein product [Caenorhabditis brenneri]
MSLSPPARFPLLKLPWLCIECVTRNCDAFDIIFFALISKKTRRITRQGSGWVVSLKLGILVSQVWNCRFTNIPGEFLSCSETIRLRCIPVEAIRIDGGNFPESGDVGVESTENLTITQSRSQPFGYAQSQKLNLLLENLEVTDTCTFLLNSTEKNLNWDPKRFKCQKLAFAMGSAAWVTREMLLQFEVPQLKFYYCPFSVEDILSFVTHWFQSDNKPPNGCPPS